LCKGHILVVTDVIVVSVEALLVKNKLWLCSDQHTGTCLEMIAVCWWCIELSWRIILFIMIWS